MNVEVNWLAVVLATLSSMVIGSIWYSKSVFGKSWQKMINLKEDQMRKGAAKALSLAVLASLVMAYVLAHVTFLAHDFFNNSFLQDALSTAFWMWLGFQGFRLVMHDSFEQRRKKLTLINLGNDLVTILVMGLIIGLVGV